MSLTKRQRDLERFHLLATMVEMGRAATAADICSQANAECSVSEGDLRLDEIDALPLISARGSTAKLSAMSLAGLVGAEWRGVEPMLWSITDEGRRVARSLESKPSSEGTTRT